VCVCVCVCVILEDSHSRCYFFPACRQITTAVMTVQFESVYGAARDSLAPVSPACLRILAKLELIQHNLQIMTAEVGHLPAAGGPGVPLPMSNGYLWWQITSFLDNITFTQLD